MTSQTVGPPGQQPQPVDPPPGASTNRNRIVLIAIAAVAAVVVLCLMAALGLFTVNRALRGGSGDPSADPTASKAAAVERDLLAAAEELWFSSAVRYRGTIVSPDGPIAVDASVTNEGALLAVLSVDGTRVEALVTSAQTFVRAGEAFWRANRAPAEQLSQYARQWVKVPNDTFGVDLRTLTPTLLAQRLGPDVFVESDDPRRPEITDGGTTTVNGVPVQVVHTDGLTVYAATAEPRRIVRISTGRPTAGEPRATTRGAAYTTGGQVPAARRAAAPSEFQLDLSDLTEAEVDDLARRLEQKIRELRSSVDSTVRFSLGGDIVLAPCTTSGCTATLTMFNTVSSDSRYLVAKQNVPASITITITLDGRTVRTCQAERSMKPNGRARVTCRATYFIPRQRRPTQHSVRAMARAVARAAVEADIKAMINDLKNEITRSRLARQQTGRAPTRTPAPSGSATASAPPCLEPPPGFSGGGPGAWKEIRRGASGKALWPIYQEYVSGVKSSREYFHQNVEFDGYLNEGGSHVFLEAKGRGRAASLKDPVDKLKELSARESQLLRQLRAIEGVPGAKLRFVAAEQDYLAAVRNHMKNELPKALYDRIEWVHKAHDFRFKGCP